MKSLVILFSICVVQCLAMSQSELEDFSNFLEITSQLDMNVKSKGPDDDYDEDEPLSENAWEESGKFEGDLILNERQRRLLVAEVAEGLSRNGLQDSTKRWPNNEVIYYIQREHFTSAQVQAILTGIEDLAQVSCVKFTPYRRGDRDAVVIQGSRRGCFSQVGYQSGYQVLNLSGRHPVGRGCFRHGTIVHELLHSLGFYHMQSSPDRDDYIDVVWQNIIKSSRHNFRKYNSFAVNDFGVGYDYESVLHYSRKAFSSNGQDTLIPRQPGAVIGQRVGLSQKDIQKLNKMYCDIDLNDSTNVVSDSVPKKPVITKKKSKNKPFDGHGIGYHQGKTVIIKLEPMVELYQVPTDSKLHTFDYFSNAQQIVPQTLTSTSGDERKITYITSAIDYKPTSKSLIQNSEQDEDDYNIKVTSSNKDNAPVKLVNDINHSNDATTDEKGLNAFSEKLDREIAQTLKTISDRLKPQQPANLYFIRDSDKYYKSESPLEKYFKGSAESLPLEFKQFEKLSERNQNFASFIPHPDSDSRETYPFEERYYNPYF